MWLHLASKSSNSSQLLMVPILALDGLLYIPGLPPPPLDTSPCTSSSCHCVSCSHVYNLSILSLENENLTAAQKALLLDHHCLGTLILTTFALSISAPHQRTQLFPQPPCWLTHPVHHVSFPSTHKSFCAPHPCVWHVMWPKPVDGHATPVAPPMLNQGSIMSFPECSSTWTTNLC